jgi:hypothetical protein
MPLKKLFQEFISSFDEGDINLLKQVELLFDEKQIEKSEMPVIVKRGRVERSIPARKESYRGRDC